VSTLDNDTFRQDALAFGCTKSAGFDYPGVAKLLPAYNDRFGTLPDVVARLKLVRKAMKTLLFPTKAQASSKKKGGAPTIRSVVAKTEILSIIDPVFWEGGNYESYVLGWRDSAAKQMNSIGSGIGWAFMVKYYAAHHLSVFAADPCARWLLQVAHDVYSFRGEIPWWQDQFSLDDMPAPIPHAVVPTLGNKKI
jgi:hypothetical protein